MRELAQSAPSHPHTDRAAWKVPPAERILGLLTVVGLVVLPTIYLTGTWDYFRPAKEIAFRAQAILAFFFLAVAVTGTGWERFRRLADDRPASTLLVLTVVWVLVTTFWSTNRPVSVESSVTLACSVILFLSIWYAARSIPVSALLVLAPVALLNAALLTLQAYQIWSPFRFRTASTEHVSTTGLIGNPNDAGGYLALCLMVLLATAPHLAGWRRRVAWAGTAAAMAGLLVSQTRAALMAVGAAVLVFALLRMRSFLKPLLLVGLVLLVAVALRLPVISRIADVPVAIARGDWYTATSGRHLPTLVSIDMIGERPLLGWGPGTFKSHYMDGRLELTGRYPAKTLLASSAEVYSEVHNDHLQLLVEAGLPGYLLFLAALVAVSRSRGNGPASLPRLKADPAGVAFAVLIFVLALASFPLQIAVTRHLIITFSALITGWRSH